MCELRPHSRNPETSFLFSAIDFSEGSQQVERFCIRFKNSEATVAFKDSVEAGREFNRLSIGGIEEDELVWADVVDDEEEQGDDNIHSTHLTTNTDPGA